LKAAPAFALGGLPEHALREESEADYPPFTKAQVAAIRKYGEAECQR